MHLSSKTEFHADANLLASLDHLKYALVHDWLPVNGGAEVMFEELCRLFPGPVYTSQCRHELFPFLDGREVHTSFVQHLPLALTKHYVYAPLMPYIYRHFDLSDAEVVLVGSHSFAHYVRPPKTAAFVCYYHTPARSLWNPEIDDRATTGHLARLRRLLAPRLKRMDLEASKGPDYVIANSRTTAGRIYEHYGRLADEIIYPPVYTQKYRDVVRVSDDGGFLAWGRLVGYKRFDLAIEAAKLTGDTVHIVGGGKMEDELKRLAAGAPNVHLHGRLPESDLKALMSRCAAVLFPGYEDFGIVPVEAMAAGLPVVAFGGGGAAETVGRNGVMIPTQTVEALAEGMRMVRRRQFDPNHLRARSTLFDVEVFRRSMRNAVLRAAQRKSLLSQ